MRKSFSFYSNLRVSLLLILTTFLVSVSFSESGLAQTSGHYLHPQGLPTGSLADVYRLGRPGQPDYFQPVQFVLPPRLIIQAARQDGFVGSEKVRQPSFGLIPGRVYRFRFSEIPFHEGAVLYPTVEIVNRLNPPTGREWDFPIEIEITQEDLELALSGNLVTRVIYLENSYNALPIDSDHQGHRVEIEADNGTDPVAIAESQGRIMAIFRMGSRVPDETPNAASSYYFGLSPFILHE